MKGFLSYRHIDNSFGLVDAIHKEITGIYRMKPGSSLDLYFDKRDTEPGILESELKKRIDACDVFIPIITENYCDPAGHAFKEFLHAHGQSDSGRGLLINPIVLGDITPTIVSSVIWQHIKLLKYQLLDNVFSESRISQIREPLHNYIIAMRRKLDGEQTLRLDDASPMTSLADQLKSIAEASKASREHGAFRDRLIHNILDDVLNEIRALNSREYLHNISLDKSFVNRAKAIFAVASEVHAVSIDSYSSFWLNASTRDIAMVYTEVQPTNTHRVFVFSSPESMLKHRWVLDAHHKRYGKFGRVLVTSLAIWKQYLTKRGGDRAAARTSEDFGILTYPMTGGVDVLATLSPSALSFSNAKADDFHLAIKTDFRIPEKTNDHPDGDSITLNPLDPLLKTFWLWREAYADERDPKAWHRCVSDVFEGDIDFSPAYHSVVTHNILFSPQRADSEFQAHMKRMIDRLLRIKVTDGSSFVKSIWFGMVMDTRLEQPIDSISTHPLFFNEEFRKTWRYCLTMSFESERSLLDYYKHPEHGDIRRELYQFLDPHVQLLYAQMEADRREGRDPARLFEIIEKVMSKQVLRLDYKVPTPYIVYQAIEAPPFGSTNSPTKG